MRPAAECTVDTAPAPSGTGKGSQSPTSPGRTGRPAQSRCVGAVDSTSCYFATPGVCILLKCASIGSTKLLLQQGMDAIALSRLHEDLARRMALLREDAP